MSSVEPPDPQPSPEVKLLADYERERARKKYLPRLIGGCALLLLLFATMQEIVGRGTTNLLIAESILLGVLVGVGILLGTSAILFYISWQYGGNVIAKGENRPSWLHALTMIGLSACAGLPGAAFAAGERMDTGRATLGFLLIFWNFSSSTLLGYLARFKAAGKPLW